MDHKVKNEQSENYLTQCSSQNTADVLIYDICNDSHAIAPNAFPPAMNKQGSSGSCKQEREAILTTPRIGGRNTGDPDRCNHVRRAAL